MGKFVAFFKAKPALALILLSGILTGFSITPSLASVIVHLINLGLLAGIYITSKQPQLTPPAVLILVSVGLTAVMVHPSEATAIFHIINFLILAGAWGLASKETSKSV